MADLSKSPSLPDDAHADNMTADNITAAPNDGKTSAHNHDGEITAEALASASPRADKPSTGISPTTPKDQAASSASASPGLGDNSDPPLPNEATPALSDGNSSYDLHNGGWTSWPYEGRTVYYHQASGAWHYGDPIEPGRNNGTGSDYNANVAGAPGTSNVAPGTSSSLGAPGTSAPTRLVAGGYNPAIHGSYDRNADYAKEYRRQQEEDAAAAAAATAAITATYEAQQSVYHGDHRRSYPGAENDHVATGNFNRYTGRFQRPDLNPDNYTPENQASRQLGAYGDIDAAANSHNGRSLREERRNQRPTKQQVKAWNKKKQERKKAKQMAYLKD